MKKQAASFATAKPAYAFRVNYPVESAKNKAYTFVDTDLLTARQNALQKLQQVLGTQRPHEVIDVKLDLIEINRTDIDSKPTVVATVVQQRVNRTMFMENGIDLLATMQMSDLAKKSLPAALFLSIGLDINGACSPQEFVAKSLTEMPDELAYYQLHGHNYSTSL